jgi:predicted NACHT family NTPase
MDEEKVYLELIKAGIKVASETLVKVAKKINDSRLQKKKIEKNKKENNENIKLNANELFNGNIILDTEKTSLSVENHIEEIRRWANIIKFSDIDRKRSLNSIYVQLDTYLMPVKKHFSLKEKKNILPLETAVLDGKEHCVILGQPGAGKTTSLKKICDLIIKEKSNTQYTFPILLRLRHLEQVSKSTILDYILDVIQIEFEFKGNKDSNLNANIEKAKEEAIISFLNYVNPIIILDGFDELKDSSAKTKILTELQKLTTKLTEAKIVLSSRTGEFNSELEYTNTYEIAPLSEKQIEVFVNKWLDNEDKANDFLNKVKNSPFADTSIKPLSLAHLCAIYERIGNIPEQPKTIYRKVVNLLIEEWDEQRSIIRKSAFEGFQTDQKFEFLTHLSYSLTVNFRSSTFSVDQFIEAYKDISEYHDLPIKKANEVVKELESHTGLLIESGYEKFEFVHKSIQEYLSADYLVKLPSLNSVKKNFEILGAELAIAVSISSNSSLYFIELVLNYLNKTTYSDAFYNSFISRIIAENPSFKQEELVSVTSLVLLSNWINPNNKKFNKYSSSTIDIEKYSIFFDLSKSLGLKEQKIRISKYYEPKKRSIQNNTIIEFSRIKIPENHRRLPTNIYIPNEFYSEFNN